MRNALRRYLLSVVCTIAVTLGVVVSASGCGSCGGGNTGQTGNSLSSGKTGHGAAVLAAEIGGAGEDHTDVGGDDHSDGGC